MIENIPRIIEKFSKRNAFFIKEVPYTYEELGQIISGIRNAIVPYTSDLKPKFVGVLVYDDIESYASCLSILLSGFGYVAINPMNPIERNLEMIRQSDLKIILSSRTESWQDLNPGYQIKFIDTKPIQPISGELHLPDASPDDPAYVIFTSGTTGIPKGTPITRKNLNAFIDSARNLGWDFSENDKFLQMSSLTFDMSIITCILPICCGACIYTVPEEEIKYLAAYKIIEKHQITVVGFLPSTISYYKPYFDEINFSSIRYSLIGGEALPLDLTDKWVNCVPNAELYNMYGPTEGTVFSNIYQYKKGEVNKQFNGIIAIGSPVKNTEVLILDEDGNDVEIGQKGELCLSGKQVTSGYLKNPEKTKEHFFTKVQNGKEKRIYKTGDLCFKDIDNCHYYVGRIDSQVKIQGHRVELGDIEKHARDFAQTKNVAAVAKKNQLGNYQLHLYIEHATLKRENVMDYLKTKLPYYMIPSNIFLLEKIPLNVNEKIDRVALTNFQDT